MLGSNAFSNENNRFEFQIPLNGFVYSCMGNKIETFANVPTTVGSKSMNTARGTCFPAPVSLKNVLKLSSPPPIVLSDGI